MVILNTEILICKNTMIKSIENIMNEVIEKYFDDEIICKTKEKKQKLMESIMKEKIKKTETKNFWYLNSSQNVCTHIFSKGKKEGYMCHRKIRTNIGNNKSDYLCSQHSKLHKPIKRERKIKNSVRKEKKRKIKKTYICNNGILNFCDIINKLIK